VKRQNLFYGLICRLRITINLSHGLINATSSSWIAVPWRSFEDTENNSMKLAPVTPETVQGSISEEKRKPSAVRKLFDAETPEAIKCCVHTPPSSPCPEVLTVPPLSLAGSQKVQFCSSGSLPLQIPPSWTLSSLNYPFLQIATPPSAFATLEAATGFYPPMIVPPVLLSGSPPLPLSYQSKTFLLPPALGASGTWDAEVQLNRESRSAFSFPPMIPAKPVTQPFPTSIDSLMEKEPASTAVNSTVRFSNGHCSKWLLRLSQVQTFTQRYGHCRIPQIYPEDPDLGLWAKRQRFHYKRYMKQVPGKSSMTKERIAILEDLGFCWDLQQEQWEEMYLQLVRYVVTKGDANVEGNNVLAMWCKRQRRIFESKGIGNGKNCLGIERFQRLDAVGFDWYSSPRRKGRTKGSNSDEGKS
jgi:hypothetical protein